MVYTGTHSCCQTDNNSDIFHTFSKQTKNKRNITNCNKFRLKKLIRATIQYPDKEKVILRIIPKTELAQSPVTGHHVTLLHDIIYSSPK